MRVVFFSLLMLGFGAILRADVDERADVHTAVGIRASNTTESEVGQKYVDGKIMRRGMLTTMLGKIVCHGNCSRDVCRAGSDADSLARYDHKQEKLRNIAKYLAEKKCISRLVWDKEHWFPRTCAAHWAEFDQRMMAFDSCSKVPKDDDIPAGSLSAAIWGYGDAAFTSIHASLQSFMGEILMLLHVAYNGNDDIKEMLQNGDCELNLNILSDEMRAATERMERGVSLEDSVKAVDHRVFGPNCNFEEAKMPWMYLRMRLLKSIRTMVHGLVEHLVHGSEEIQVETLLTKSMDESSANDDPNVAKAEDTLLNGDSKEGSFQPPDEGEGTSLVELGTEPVVTTTGVLVGTGIIVAALVGGFAVLAVIGLVLRALMMTRRITFKDRTTA